MGEVNARLADDHSAIDGVLTELKTALESNDVENSHTKLDLFWARLAVHIRAEHLHLFPTVIEGVWEKHAPGPFFTAAAKTIEHSVKTIISLCTSLHRQFRRSASSESLQTSA